MKLFIILTLLLTSTLSFAQTQRELALRDEMLKRVDLLINHTKEVRKALDKNLAKKDVARACENIEGMYEIYPEHVKAVGIHLNMFEGKVVKLRNDAVAQLMYIHRQSLVCKQGKDSEYLDMGQVNKAMKDLNKALTKHKKIISKTDADQDNYFYYEYEL